MTSRPAPPVVPVDVSRLVEGEATDLIMAALLNMLYIDFRPNDHYFQPSRNYTSVNGMLGRLRERGWEVKGVRNRVGPAPFVANNYVEIRRGRRVVRLTGEEDLPILICRAFVVAMAALAGYSVEGVGCLEWV